MLGTNGISRILIAGAAAAALYLPAGTAAAWAHVHASSDDAARGSEAIVTFEVPNESSTRAATTALTVFLPDVVSANAEAMPGWTVKLDRDAAAGTVRSVTWTAAPNGGIPADQFALFRISVQLPDADTVSFPATQTYSDGSIVKWDQPPQPGGGEPEHPVPTLTLAAGPAVPHDHAPPSMPMAQSKPAADNTARVLGGVALIVAALGLCLALVRRRP
jgi:uncharacterized protein YcnI